MPTTYCKEWSYPADKHRPLCNELYEPKSGTEGCPVCVQPALSVPGCSTVPCGSTNPLRVCDTWTVPYNVDTCVDTFTPIQQLTVTPPIGSGVMTDYPWKCSGNAGTFLLQNNDKCNTAWVSTGKGPIGPDYLGPTFVECYDGIPTGSGVTSGLYRWVAYIYRNSNYVWWQIHLHYGFETLYHTIAIKMFRTEYVPRQAKGGKGLDCKQGYKVMYERTTNEVGQIVWQPLSYFNYGPNFSITIKGL